VINIGDMLQRLTNHYLPSTTHRVRNPDAERAAYSRYSMPFFLHCAAISPSRRCRNASARKTPTAIPSRSRRTITCRNACAKSG
jgi:isopenicillin N synthase-like dioxygenase